MGVLAAGAMVIALRMEGELRAALRLAWTAAGALAVWGLIIALGPEPAQQVVTLLAVLGFGLPVVLVVRGFILGRATTRAVDLAAVGVGTRPGRVDERDTIFARMNYTPGGPAFADYYSRHPERRDIDDTLRALPELCGPGSATYDPLNSRIAPAIFGLLAEWRSGVEMKADDAVSGRIGPEGQGAGALGDRTSPAAMTARIKGLARLYGALDVGVTRLPTEFVYSHVGRREEEYGRRIGPGAEVDFDHRYAVVFTVEMDYRFVRAAPRLPVVVESSHQYLEAAKIALALAANIRALGWDARAHMDGNYLAVLPPLAAAAGLGEIGRMGLLVTENHGPRVRLGMVSTNLPLVCDQPRPFGVQSFCRLCKKCARNCPAQAISEDDEPDEAGWRISWEDCYRFWRRTGTDCAMCLNSCPYSKPDTMLHRMLRAMIRELPPAQRVALWADDFLYGRRPLHRWKPDWF